MNLLSSKAYTIQTVFYAPVIHYTHITAMTFFTNARYVPIPLRSVLQELISLYKQKGIFKKIEKLQSFGMSLRMFIPWNGICETCHLLSVLLQPASGQRDVAGAQDVHVFSQLHCREVYCWHIVGFISMSIQR